MLTPERLREVLHYDPETGVFTWRVRAAMRTKVGGVAGYTGTNGYPHLTIDSKKYLASRVAWLYMTGAWPTLFIDHKDGFPLNNSFSNLREATPTVNANNRHRIRSDNTTGFLGVVASKPGKFAARITVAYKSYALGVYSTPEEAHAVYLEAKRRLHEGCTL